MNTPIVDHRAPPRESVSAADRERVLDLYGEGLYIKAWEASKAFGPLEDWTGTESRIVAARLLHNLGAPRRSGAWTLRAFRADPSNPTASYFGHRGVLHSRGPLAAWRSMEQSPLPADTDPDTLADWYALHARVLGGLRDFEPAERWMKKAFEVRPERSWLFVEHSGILLMQDRHEAALEALRHSLELRPWYRPAVQSLAYTLVQQNAEEEAEALLREAKQRLESCHVVGQLAQLLLELRKVEEAREVWTCYEPLAPMLEEKGKVWLRANQTDTAYLCGDLDAAVELGQEAGEWHKKVAANTAYDPDGRRAMLEVGFVRQHHRTCGPASLTMVCDYWDQRGDHLELADEICYDGTTNRSERAWAEKEGWAVREFTVNWKDTVALIDRGVPFTLVTTEPTSAHLQIVMGYDERRETLLIRDPGSRHHQEFLAERTFWRYRSTGPRGMAFVPAAEASRLDDLELLDEALYDLVYRMESALHDHERAAAEEAFQALSETAPGHRATLAAERNLGLYDMDTARTLRATEGLLALYPECGIFELRKLGLLERLGRREELLTLLEEAAERETADPAFRERYACELLADARQHDRAAYLLRRAMRRRPTAAINLDTMADLLSEQRRFAEALPLYRFAACLEHRQERFAKSYFRAARYAGDVLSGLEFLQERVARYGHQSGQPVQTLVWAYSVLGQAQEGHAALDDALRRRPDDGALGLFAAEEYGRGGELEHAKELLGRAEGKTARLEWLRTAALIARLDGRPQEAIRCWRELVEADPLSVQAHASLARLLSKSEGRSAAVAHLEAAVQAMPRNQGLLKELIGWYSDEELEAREAAVRQCIENNPLDPWGYRELAVCLGDQRRFEEGHAALDEALRLDPHSCAAYGILGDLHRKAGELAEARVAFQQALLFDIDYPFAIARWLRCCETAEDRAEALACVREEIGKQRVYGAAIMAIYEEWRGVGDPEEILVVLRECKDQHSELWEAWSALVGQLGDMERLDEALEVAEEQLRRFPFQAQVRRDLAWVHRLRGDDAAEVAALERLLVVVPAERGTVRMLAGVHLRRGRLEEARALLEPEIALAPFDAELHSLLAQVRWELGDREAAVQQQEQALRIAPRTTGAPWSRLESWSRTLEDPERPLRLAREMAEANPQDAGAWLRLARRVPADRLDELLEASAKALAIDPREHMAHDLRAERLADAKRFDEALAECEPEAFEGHIPLVLRGRKAWVLARSGDRPGAIELMRKTLDGSPTYFWGWLRLSDWCRGEKDHEGHLAAAQALVRLAPQDDLALSHLGSALERTGDRDGAKAAFARALEHAPDAWFAGTNLADLLKEDGEHERAREILTFLAERYPEDEDVWAGLAEVGVETDSKDEALEAVRRLALIQCPNDQPFQKAGERVAKKGWAKELIELFETLLDDPGVHASIGRAWVDAMSYSDRLLECEPRIETLPAPVQRVARIDFVESLVETEHFSENEKRKQLLRYVRERGDVLRADGELWGTVCYSLNRVGEHDQVVEWGSDWRERKDVEPWMLSNLSRAHFETKRHEGARDVAAGALELPDDHASNYCRVLLAFEVCRDEPARARELQVASEGAEMGIYFTFLRTLTAATLAGQEDWSEGRRLLGEACAVNTEFWAKTSLRRAYLRSAWAIAPGPLGVLWFLWIWLLRTAEA